MRIMRKMCRPSIVSPHQKPQFLNLLPDFFLADAGGIVIHGQTAVFADADGGDAGQGVQLPLQLVHVVLAVDIV